MKGHKRAPPGAPRTEINRGVRPGRENCLSSSDQGFLSFHLCGLVIYCGGLAMQRLRSGYPDVCEIVIKRHATCTYQPSPEPIYINQARSVESGKGVTVS